MVISPSLLERLTYSPLSFEFVDGHCQAILVALGTDRAQAEIAAEVGIEKSVCQLPLLSAYGDSFDLAAARKRVATLLPGQFMLFSGGPGTGKSLVLRQLAGILPGGKRLGLLVDVSRYSPRKGDFPSWLYRRMGDQIGPLKRALLRLSKRPELRPSQPALERVIRLDTSFSYNETATGVHHTVVRRLVDKGQILPIIDGLECLPTPHRLAVLRYLAVMGCPAVCAVRPNQLPDLRPTHWGQGPIFGPNQLTVVGVGKPTAEHLAHYLEQIDERIRMHHGAGLGHNDGTANDGQQLTSGLWRELIDRHGMPTLCATMAGIQLFGYVYRHWNCDRKLLWTMATHASTSDEFIQLFQKMRDVNASITTRRYPQPFIAFPDRGKVLCQRLGYLDDFSGLFTR